MKKKTIWAYLDGKKLVDVVQAALDNNVMVAEIKPKPPFGEVVERIATYHLTMAS